MDNLFNPLVTVVYRHSYYNDGKLKLFRVFPAEETAAWLLNNDLLYRQYDDRFTIYYNSLFHSSERDREAICATDMTLQFYVTNSDNYFAQYTEGVSGIVPGVTLPVFSNSYADGYLHAGAVVDDTMLEFDATLLQQLPLANRRPFACIRLTLQPALPDLYTIQFAARATYWRYILAAGYLQQLQNPAVIGRQGKEVFKGPEWITLPDQARAICFVSNDKIPLNEIPAREWQLVEQYDAVTGRYKVVKKVLPAPDISHISVIEAGEKAALYNYSEIIL